MQYLLLTVSFLSSIGTEFALLYSESDAVVGATFALNIKHRVAHLLSPGRHYLKIERNVT